MAEGIARGQPARRRSAKAKKAEGNANVTTMCGMEAGRPRPEVGVALKPLSQKGCGHHEGAACTSAERQGQKEGTTDRDIS